ncbi:MAG: hypothetical protein KJ649_08575, partial [Proteobacteria bacterium]|nr:hypothetical protein [Pseudomonadota bacterium]
MSRGFWPTIIEKRVSRNSYFNWRAMTAPRISAIAVAAAASTAEERTVRDTHGLRCRVAAS